MQVKTITLASGANPVIPRSSTGILADPIAQFQSVTFYNPDGTNACYIGDALVSSTNGIKLAAGATITFNCALDYGEDLKGWFVAGTAASKVTVLWF